METTWPSECSSGSRPTRSSSRTWPLVVLLPFPPSVPHPKCPVCASHLRRITVDQTTIEIDLCDQHGTWFDRNEFQAVAKWLEKCRRPFDDFPPPLHFDPADYHRYFRNGHGGWRGDDDGWSLDFGDFGDFGDGDSDGGDGGDGGGGDGGD
ncbi:zf-TFIIB domain-containing protein [Pendulispora albinea]|uniref:zf-TFIIB domain-containing protein n=1 Tax=Pendulispora albinea TaxID=2741071 RepID=UPI00374E1A95